MERTSTQAQDHETRGYGMSRERAEMDNISFHAHKPKITETESVRATEKYERHTGKTRNKQRDKGEYSTKDDIQTKRGTKRETRENTVRKTTAKERTKEAADRKESRMPAESLASSLAHPIQNRATRSEKRKR